MSHPFLKIFDAALKKSTPMDNVVLKEAEKLKEKGYSAHEIYTVLSKFRQSLISDRDNEIATEAIEEFEAYI